MQNHHQFECVTVPPDIWIMSLDTMDISAKVPGKVLKSCCDIFPKKKTQPHGCTG